MRNNLLTLDFLGACLMGAVLGGMLAHALLGGV